MALIGEILVAQGQLMPDGLQEALDWQVLYGGRLGTNLLELQLVREEALARALGVQMGVEVAWGDLRSEEQVLGAVPRQTADRQEMVPWKMDKRRLKILCTRVDVKLLDELSYKSGRTLVAVVAPEFRIFQLLRLHYGVMRQMRALDFGVVPREGRRRKETAAKVSAGPELIDEAAFNDMYSQLTAGSKAVPVSAPSVRAADAAPAAEVLEPLPDDAILGELAPEEAEPEPEPAAKEAPLDFASALRALAGVTDRDQIAHLVLLASRSRAARALLLQVQGAVAVGWDGLGDGMENARAVALPLAADSAFALVVKTRSHYLGPLRKTPSNIRFLAALGKQVPRSAAIFPILHGGRVLYMLYLDNGHKQQAPTDVGEMLILSQRIGQTVGELVARKRSATRA
jgi:hypothetical protein